jgi:hypothetical protein
MPSYDSNNDSDGSSRPAREGFSSADANKQRYKEARSFRGPDGALWYVQQLNPQGAGGE